MLDTNNVKYGRREIIQASDLKEHLEPLQIKKSNSTIASVDAESMYPSIKFSLITKAVLYYAKGLDEDDLFQVQMCLRYLKFGMGATLISYQDRFYLYDGDKPIEEKGLTIGGYESAWLADLAMSYLLETVDDGIIDQLKYFGIYRDDGLAIFEGIKSATDINDWLKAF